MRSRDFIFLSRMLGLVALLAALVPGSIGIWFYARTSSFLARTVTAEGTVVELLPQEGTDGTMYQTVFEYRDASGIVHRQTPAWSSNPPAYAIGQAVEVVYDPNDPANGKINSFWNLWLGAFVCGVIAVFPLAIGLFFIWLVPFVIRRLWPKPAEPAVA